MAVRLCTVSYVGLSGIRHAVDVQAESVYEAAAAALAVFKGCEWSDGVGAAMPLHVKVRQPETTHTVTVDQIRRWCDGVAVSPNALIQAPR